MATANRPQAFGAQNNNNNQPAGAANMRPNMQMPQAGGFFGGQGMRIG